MRKLCSFILTLLLLFPVTGMAETDLSAMSIEELTQLQTAVNLELASRTSTKGALATWESEGCFRIDLISVERGVDRDGNPGVCARFSFTNLSAETTTFSHFAEAFIYQDGGECEWAFINGANGTTHSSRVLSGGTYSGVLYGALLTSDTPTIQVEITTANYPYESFGVFTIALPPIESTEPAE